MTQSLFPKATTKQWAVMTLLTLWGFASFIVLAGEDAPDATPTPLGKFLLIKGIALVSLALCFLAGKYFDKKGLLPDVEE